MKIFWISLILKKRRPPIIAEIIIKKDIFTELIKVHRHKMGILCNVSPQIKVKDFCNFITSMNHW